MGITKYDQGCPNNTISTMTLKRGVTTMNTDELYELFKQEKETNLNRFQQIADILYIINENENILINELVKLKEVNK